MRQPSSCVRAVRGCVALMLSRNMTCVRPRCNATPSEGFLHISHASRVSPVHFNTSHLHFTLCTSCHFTSSELFLPHFISFNLVSFHPTSFFMSSSLHCLGVSRDRKHFLKTNDTTFQCSCSHSNAICNKEFQNNLKLRTHTNTHRAP